jgi:hypothetical protein
MLCVSITWLTMGLVEASFLWTEVGLPHVTMYNTIKLIQLQQ